MWRIELATIIFDCFEAHIMDAHRFAPGALRAGQHPVPRSQRTKQLRNPDLLLRAFVKSLHCLQWTGMTQMTPTFVCTQRVTCQSTVAAYCHSNAASWGPGQHKQGNRIYAESYRHGLRRPSCSCSARWRCLKHQQHHTV